MRKVDSDRIQSLHMQALRRILGIRWCDVLDSTSIAANLCSAISVVNLFCLFTVMFDFACWSILDVLDSRVLVIFWSHVLLAVLFLVFLE